MGSILFGLAFLLGVYVVYKLLDSIIRLPRIGNYADRCIFVTGCDSGFGHGLVKRLDSLGCRVFAGCYTERGETELRKTCSERVLPIPLDVTSPDSVRKAFQLVSKELASSGKVGPPDWLSADDYRNTCEVNLFGMIDVSMTFLPLLKKSGGRIVNMASCLGRLSVPMTAPYCVSKFGVEAFTDALRRSAKLVGCKAIVIEPSAYRTPMMTDENTEALCDRSWNRCSEEKKKEYGTDYLETLKADFKSVNICSDISPVVDAYEHALMAQYPRSRYLVGYDAQFTAVVASLSDYITDSLVAMVARKTSRQCTRAQQDNHASHTKCG